jgi:hypothetical protein
VSDVISVVTIRAVQGIHAEVLSLISIQEEGTYRAVSYVDAPPRALRVPYSRAGTRKRACLSGIIAIVIRAFRTDEDAHARTVVSKVDDGCILVAWIDAIPGDWISEARAVDGADALVVGLVGEGELGASSGVPHAGLGDVVRPPAGAGQMALPVGGVGESGPTLCAILPEVRPWT